MDELVILLHENPPTCAISDLTSTVESLDSSCV